MLGFAALTPTYVLRVTETGFDKIPAGHRAEAFRLNPAALDQLRTYVEQISEQWDSSLARLKAFVEK